MTVAPRARGHGLQTVTVSRIWGSNITPSKLHALIMLNIASVLKDEISRISRKEMRRETSSLKKSSAAHRSEIAALGARARAPASPTWSGRAFVCSRCSKRRFDFTGQGASA